MVKINKKLVATFMGGALLALLTANVHAFPSLQLDIIGGTYSVAESETILSEGDSGTLVAYGQNDNGSGDTINTDNNFFVSVSLFKYDNNEGDDIALLTDFGSFEFGTTTYQNGDLVFGTAHPGAELPNHGVFPTLYTEVAFVFDEGQTRDAIDTQSVTGSDPLLNLDPLGGLYFVTFGFDASGLNDNFGLHFDLYEISSADGTLVSKAPFSHDAQTNVPEPAPLALMGMGLLAVFLSSKRKGA
jgi:hypothetical protein